LVIEVDAAAPASMKAFELERVLRNLASQPASASGNQSRAKYVRPPLYDVIRWRGALLGRARAPAARFRYGLWSGRVGPKVKRGMTYSRKINPSPASCLHRSGGTSTGRAGWRWQSRSAPAATVCSIKTPAQPVDVGRVRPLVAPPLRSARSVLIHQNSPGSNCVRDTSIGS
jgi:hypothetical protein